MRRLVNYLINNIREHFMLYIVLWSLLAIIDVIYIVFFLKFSLTFIDTPLNLFNLYFLKNVTSNLLNEAIEIHCGNTFKFAEIN